MSTTTVPTIVVYVSVPKGGLGTMLAGSVVNERLAASVNLIPGVASVYWSDNAVINASEELLIIKTRESLLPALTDYIKFRHKYVIPEIISLPITGGNVQYLEYIKNNTKEK